jgi:hypothetical protein
MQRFRMALAVIAALATPASAAERWEVLRKSPEASLAIDQSSIKRTGDLVSFAYLIDYAKVQADFKAGVAYRSLIVRGQARCSQRSIALGNTDIYSEPGAKGTNLGTTFPDRIEASFQRVEAGTSDEELLKRVCRAKK